jgi:uncharacterized protein with PQ loop repeat
MDIRRWEFNAFAVEAFLLAVTAVVIAITAGQQLTSLPSYIWFGIGMLLMLLLGIPIETVYFRATRGRELPLGRMSAFSFLGAVIGAIVYRLMQ